MQTDEQLETPEITDQQRKRSMVFAVASSIGTVIGNNCIASTVMSLFAIKLGADEIFLGFMSFVATVPLFFYLFTMSAIERIGKRRILIGWFLGATICVIPFMLVPMMVKWGVSGRICLGVILIASFLRTACAALGGTGWFPLLQDIVPAEKIGHFFAMLRTSWSAAPLILLLLIAWFLGDDPDWWKFEVLFVVGFFATLMRALMIIPMTEKRPEGEKAVKQSIISRFREVWAIKSLRLIIIYIFISCLAATTTKLFPTLYDTTFEKT